MELVGSTTGVVDTYPVSHTAATFIHFAKESSKFSTKTKLSLLFLQYITLIQGCFETCHSNTNTTISGIPPWLCNGGDQNVRKM